MNNPGEGDSGAAGDGRLERRKVMNAREGGKCDVANYDIENVEIDDFTRGVEEKYDAHDQQGITEA